MTTRLTGSIILLNKPIASLESSRQARSGLAEEERMVDAAFCLIGLLTIGAMVAAFQLRRFFKDDDNLRPWG